MIAKRVAFLFGKLIMCIGSEPVIDFVVNSWHIVTRVKRVQVGVLCAWKRERGRGFHATNRC